MTRPFLSLTAAVSAIAVVISSLMVSCSFSAKERSENQQYQVLLPWNTEGQYSLQVITLRTLQNLTAVQGSTATMTYGFKGPAVKIRAFQRSDGVYVPVGTGQQLVSVYAHLEKLRDLDEQLGIGGVIERPFSVAINVRIRSQGQNQLVENNAQYSPKSKALFFAPFKDEALPMTVNAGVIGHEYFHALFDQLALKPIGKSIPTELNGELAGQPEVLPEMPDCSRPEGGKVTPVDSATMHELYHIRLLRAMNEGLADVWGWIYSGDQSFVGKSIPTHSDFRQLDGDLMMVSSAFKFLQLSNSQGVCSRDSGQAFVYELGTIYARWIKKSFKGWDRLKIARTILETLPQLVESVKTLAPHEKLKPSILMELLAKNIREGNPEVCQSLLAGVSRFEMKDPAFSCQRGSGK